MFLLEGISQLATCRSDGGQGDIHAIQDGALAWDGDTIRWAGPRRELPPELTGADRLDAGGRLVIPGLVDCHTHLAFGGWRAEEFEQRILGRSYLDIAAGGGGIARTMRLTRAASQASLVERSAGFLREMVSLGVTTVECKSGYGLDREHAPALLQVYRPLAGAQPVRLVPT
jgi:imidazolonepropionase